MTTAKPAGESRPRWTLTPIENYFAPSQTDHFDLLLDGIRVGLLGPFSAEAIVAALNAAQPGDAPKLTVDDVTDTMDQCDRTAVVSAEWVVQFARGLNALLASRSTQSAPASTEALIAAGDALRKTLDALIEKWYDRLNNIYGWGESADCLQECAEELRAAVATLHPASEGER